MNTEEQKRNKIRVDIADAVVSSNPSDLLVTYSLGSCIGLCMYDPRMQIGGMLHCLLPQSAENPHQAKLNPFRYADTGVTAMLEKIISMGAAKRRLIVKIAGAASTLKTVSDSFDIGKRNYLTVRKVLWKHGMLINAEDVGRSLPRTMYLDIADGSVTISSRGQRTQL